MRKLFALVLGGALAGSAALWLYGAPPPGLPAGIRGPLSGIAHALHQAPHPWRRARGTVPSRPASPARPAARATIRLTGPALVAEADRGSIAAVIVDGEPCGTAWSVRGDGVWMTADDVIAGCGRTGIRLRPWGASWSVPATLWSRDQADDLAVLTAYSLPRPALPLTTTLPLGTAVAVMDDAVVTGAPPSGPRVGRALAPTVITPRSPILTETWTLRPALTLSIRCDPGESGGPVLDAAGAVVGQVDAWAPGLTYAVSAALIRTWAPWAQ